MVRSGQKWPGTSRAVVAMHRQHSTRRQLSPHVPEAHLSGWLTGTHGLRSGFPPFTMPLPLRQGPPPCSSISSFAIFFLVHPSCSPSCALSPPISLAVRRALSCPHCLSVCLPACLPACPPACPRLPACQSHPNRGFSFRQG